MLFAGWEVRMVKDRGRGLDYAARGRRSQFFTIQTDPWPVNNMFIYFIKFNEILSERTQMI